MKSPGELMEKRRNIDQHVLQHGEIRCEHIYIKGPPPTQNVELELLLPGASPELNLKQDTQNILLLYVYIYKVDGVLRICPISTLRVWTEKNLEYFRQTYLNLGQNFGVHKQCQSKYHRNNDIPISKTCAKPRRLDIFWVLGQKYLGQNFIFLRITTRFHWFSLQNSSFFIVLRHQSWGVGTLR